MQTHKMKIFSNKMKIFGWILLPFGLLATLFYSQIGHILFTSVCRSEVSLLPAADAHRFWHDPHTFPGCSMDACFNFSLCAARHHFRIYLYGAPYKPVSYFDALSASPWVTTDANQACIFLVIEPESYSLFPIRRHPSSLPHWNGGLNHVIVSLADKWLETAPPPHSLGNASVMASTLQETSYRSGFDISIPLPGRKHLHRQLKSLKPWERRYFLTFKGTRYLGNKEGNFRSDAAFRHMHNGEDIVVAVTCQHETNNKIRRMHPAEGKGCDEDEKLYRAYDFDDLMNVTFGLAPAGRSPASHRMIEILSAGAIPVLIADNYVKPFDTFIQWHRCLLQFPTSEMQRIVPALRSMTSAEMQRRQRYCLSVYEAYLKDDATLARSVVRALQLRFYGMFPHLTGSMATEVDDQVAAAP